MKKQFFPLTAILPFVLLSGCSKDNNNNNSTPAPTKTELITKSSWNFDHATSGGTDITAAINACYKDNVVTFTSATNGTVNEGANVCTSPAPATFTWMFQSNETALSLSAAIFATGSGNFSIISLTDASLVISQDVIVPPSSSPNNVVFYYKH